MKTLCTDVFWIRLHLSTFDDPRWLVIEQLPEAEAVENIYTRLLMLAGKTNADGLLLLYDHVPYTIDTLSAVLRRKKAVVELAMSILTHFNFIELIGDVYAVLDWDHLQFTDDLAKIAERREKDKIRQSKKRHSLKLLTTNTSLDASTDILRTSALTESETKLERKTGIEKKNDNVVDLDPAKRLLQKIWPEILTSETAIKAVAKALASKCEDYVYDNIEYVRRKAKGNPAKYLADALSCDYATHQDNRVQKTLTADKFMWQAEAERIKREEEDEELRKWQASPEGQSNLAYLRDKGVALPDTIS